MAELKTPIQLCDPGRPGRLNPAAVGWSRRPIQRCNLSRRWPRKKRWNYWAFTTETHLFSMTVSNIDYIGLAFLYVVDFEAETVIEETIVSPLGRGCDLPETVDEDVHFVGKTLELSMRHSADASGRHKVAFAADMPTFGGKGLSARLDALYPIDHDTLNVVIPWDDKRFQFTAKHNTLPVTGSVEVGDDAPIEFGSEQSFATLDFGRGVWPTRCVWNWGSASGLRDGRTIGLNLGGKWTDGTGQTENGVCIDGVLAKNDHDLLWDYDPADWMRPWRIKSPTNDDIDVEFTPRVDRAASTNAILIKPQVHQLLGTYSGCVRDAEGRLVRFENLIGWAEEHRAVW
jgi:hypothetical protein